MRDPSEFHVVRASVIEVPGAVDAMAQVSGCDDLLPVRSSTRERRPTERMLLSSAQEVEFSEDMLEVMRLEKKHVKYQFSSIKMDGGELFSPRHSSFDIHDEDDE